jgi:hypothetical protein
MHPGGCETLHVLRAEPRNEDHRCMGSTTCSDPIPIFERRAVDSEECDAVQSKCTSISIKIEGWSSVLDVAPTQSIDDNWQSKEALVDGLN